MQSALLIYENEAEAYAEGEAGQDIVQAHGAFAGSLVQSGAMRGGEGLKPTTTATTVRITPDGRTVHDDPFAETREQLAGYSLIEAADPDAAVEIARRAPSSPGGPTCWPGGTVAPRRRTGMTPPSPFRRPSRDPVPAAAARRSVTPPHCTDGAGC